MSVVEQVLVPEGLDCPWSENARRWMQRAVELMKARHHTELASEHLLYSLLTMEDPPRIVDWMCVQAELSKEELQARVQEELEQREVWAAGPVVEYDIGTPFHTTRSLAYALELVRQFACGVVTDESLKITHATGIVCCEFVMAGMLLEGTCMCADIVQRVSDAKIHVAKILSDINVTKASIKRKDCLNCTVKTFEGEAAAQVPWTPPATLPEVSSLSKGPTPASNWIIQDRLLIGAKPGNWCSVAEDVAAMLECGITTFVCLIGEYVTMKRYMSSYPAKVKQLAPSKAFSFLWFPIPDRDSTGESELADLSMELARRLKEGEKVFIHCYGGKGRTGMVVMSLLAGLYRVDPFDAREYMLQATRHGRAIKYHLEMPEEPPQERAAASAAEMMRKGRR